MATQMRLGFMTAVDLGVAREIADKEAAKNNETLADLFATNFGLAPEAGQDEDED